jgi:hypothetical protein
VVETLRAFPKYRRSTVPPSRHTSYQISSAILQVSMREAAAAIF